MSDVQPPQSPYGAGEPGAYGQQVPQGPPSPAPGAWGLPAEQGGPAQQPGTAGQPGAAQQPGGAQRRPGQHPAGTDLGADLGASLTFGWQGFARNLAALLIPGIVYLVVVFAIITAAVIIGVVIALPQFQEAAASGSEDPPLGAILTIYAPLIPGILIAALVQLLWTSGAYRAAAIIADGGRPTIGQAFIGSKNILLTMLLAGVLTTIGFLLFYLPGLVVSVLVMYAAPAAARGARPVEALEQSFAAVKNHLGASIVLMLVLGVISSVAGSIIIPVIALVPFMALALLGMFDRVNGRELVDPATKDSGFAPHP